MKKARDLPTVRLLLQPLQIGGTERPHGAAAAGGATDERDAKIKKMQATIYDLTNSFANAMKGKGSGYRSSKGGKAGKGQKGVTKDAKQTRMPKHCWASRQYAKSRASRSVLLSTWTAVNLVTSAFKRVTFGSNVEAVTA